jgi:hypothetical protein
LVDGGAARADRRRALAAERQPEKPGIGAAAAGLVVPGVGNPQIDGLGRYVEGSARRPEHRDRRAGELGGGEVAAGDAVKSVDIGAARIAHQRGDIDPAGRGDAPEGGSAVAAPAADAGQRLERVLVPIEIERRVEDQAVADQPRGVVARRIIIVRLEMPGVLEAKPAGGIDPKAVYLGAAAGVAVADDDDPVAGDQHLVIPVAAARDSGREGVDRIDRPHPPAAKADGEQPAAAEDDEMLAADLDDVALVDARFLIVGDARLPRGERLGERVDLVRNRGDRGASRRRHHGLRRRRRHRHEGRRDRVLLALQPAQIGAKLGVGAEGAKAAARSGRGLGEGGVDSGEREQGEAGEQEQAGRTHGFPFYKLSQDTLYHGSGSRKGQNCCA